MHVGFQQSLGLLEENTFEVSLHYGFNFPLTFFFRTSSPPEDHHSKCFQRGNVVVSQFPFHIFVMFVKFWQFFIQVVLTSTYSSSLREGCQNLEEGETLFSESFASPPPTLSVCDVAQSLMLDVSRIFVSVRMRPEGIFMPPRYFQCS